MYFFIFKTTQLEPVFDDINDDLLVKFLLGEASAGESAIVQQWINATEFNNKYYQQLKQIWDTSNALAVVSTTDENKAWQQFKTRISNAADKQALPKRPSFTWMKLAASVLLLVGLSLATYFIVNRQAATPTVLAQTTVNTLTDTLPDGSVVTLNKKSSISYPGKFKSATRTVALKGEAFFKVKVNKERPFVVTVNDVQVTVVGTSFNIKNESGYTEVIVETGVVEVSRAGQITTLKAGEKLRLNDGSQAAVKEAVSDQLYNYYRSRQFVCDDTPLWKLVEVLNEAYGANISIGRPGLKTLKINTTFNNESLDKILEIIHLTFDITVIRKDGQVILQ